MKFRYYKIPLMAILMLSVILISCKEEWENHYYEKALNKSSLNMLEYIQSRNELSKFYEMLRITHYDTLLNKSQTFTVWAPNNDALADVNLSDTVELKKIVANHITRFSCSTLGISRAEKTILMLNNKLIPFAKGSAGFTFGGKAVIESDIATQNGIIHIVGGYVPYTRNIWEYISETPGLDSLKAFINSLTLKELDNTKSFQDGVFVDSIFKSTNYLFDNLAAIPKEDSIYTAILPDNTAWSEAYNRIFPFFKSQEKDGGLKAQVAYTKSCIVNDLFFKGKKTLPINTDTLKSTSGSIFVHPNRLFEGSTGVEMSNGYSYVTNKLHQDSTESWYKPIRIEAEWPFYGRQTVNYTANQVSSIGTGYPVSSRYYLSLIDASTSSLSKIYATFPIPNTLSARYNIYCVFVPTKIVDSTDLRPYRVRFYLSYLKANQSGAAVQVTNANIDANNNVLSTTTAGGGGVFVTDPENMTKMLVAKNVRFDFTNLKYNVNDPKNPITVSLKVENAADKTAAHILAYNRNLKIDCIILEPVQ